MLNTTIILVWLGLVGGAMGMLLQYQYTPGSVITVEDLQDMRMLDQVHSQNEQAILFFLHPSCSCSRASIAEMARVQALHPVPITVVCSELDDDFRVQVESALGKVNFICDVEGHVHNAYQAHTSGHVIYISNKTVLYAGGVTAARGHEGGNAYASALEHCIEHQQQMESTSVVFGCDL